MQKAISIIRGFKDESYEAFHERISAVIEKIKTCNLSRLSYTITIERPPKMGVIPFSKEKIAMVSVWDEEDNNLELIQQQDGYSGTCMVTEALPVAYEKNWKDGEATPGVCLLTLFRQNKKIDYETFMHRWYNGHTPLTLKIHPIYHYNRNAVEANLGDPPILYDGIVEEHCRTLVRN